MTLKEFATLLKLSPTTVSRALNGYPEVSETTRQRVRAEADRLGYRPNAGARWLATGRSHAIGHVLALPDSDEMTNPIFGDFIAGAGAVYAEHGYNMLLSLVPEEQVARTYRNLAADGSVDGVILHGPRMDDPRIALLREIGLPFVVHGRASGITAPYAWVDVNNRSAFLRATEFLLGLGHRRIALINGDEALDFAHRRRRGYEDALGAAQISPDPRYMRAGEMNERNGYCAARDMLDQPDPPTAFLVASLISAIGVRRAIMDRGLSLGADVSVICFDDMLSYMESGLDVPLFTVTRSSVREAGEHCARMLLKRINDPSDSPQNTLLEAQLILGQSTGACRS